MSDEKVDNAQPEKSSVITPQEAHQESKQQEKPPEIKQVNLSESATKNAGDQGISLNPVGGHDTNPFVSQDIVQSQPVVQIETPTPPSVETVIPPLPPQSSGGGGDAGE